MLLLRSLEISARSGPFLGVDVEFLVATVPTSETSAAGRYPHDEGLDVPVDVENQAEVAVLVFLEVEWQVLIAVEVVVGV